jgi:hypothetical protein
LTPQQGNAYFGQYTNPQQPAPYQAPAGMGSVQTGISATPPQLPPGALQSLMQYPQTNYAGNFGGQGSYGPGVGNFVNNLYGAALNSGNLESGNQLSQLFNQQNAANNMALGTAQGQLGLGGIGLALNQLGFGLNQQLDYSNLLRGLYGNLMGNMLGMTGL